MKLLDKNSIKGKMPMNKSNHIHQGNVRAVIGQSGVLEEVNGYYPYGGITGPSDRRAETIKLHNKTDKL